VPADGGFARVAIAGVGDPDGDPVTIAVESITQDEPLHRAPCADGAGVGGPLAELRAARRDRHGRAYRVRFEADDGHGGRCGGSVLVCVPGPRAGAGPCAEHGTTVLATAPECTGACAVACGVERSLGFAACAGESVPPKLSRAVEKARRRLVRTARRGEGPWTSGAVRSIERAVRMTGDARAAGTISASCGDALSQILGDARSAVAPLVGGDRAQGSTITGVPIRTRS
jgi:hypothetical protein